MRKNANIFLHISQTISLNLPFFGKKRILQNGSENDAEFREKKICDNFAKKMQKCLHFFYEHKLIEHKANIWRKILNFRKAISSFLRNR